MSSRLPARSTHTFAGARTAARRMPLWVIAIFCIGGLTYAVMFALAILQTDTDLLGGLTIAPVLLACTVPIAFKLARADRDPMLVGIIMAGVVAKFLGSLARYYVAFLVYGNSDSLQYHQAAQILAPDFRRGIFNPGLGPISGTVFIKVFTGIVYAAFGTSPVTGFFVFAWLGFLGLLLLARAFRIAVPQGDSRRYLILVLFLPSLVYWPSAIGKEAWMMLTIGLCAHGIACLLRGRSAGVITLGLGLVGTVLVRPHIGLILFVGFVLAMLVRRAPARTYAAPLFRLLGLGVLIVVGLVLVSQTASFLNEPSLTAEAVSNTLSRNQTQTNEDGSRFSPVVVSNPVDMVPAFVTILYRPFPFEATNPQSLLAAMEGVVLLALSAMAWKRIRAIPRMMRDTPYVTFCVGYVLAFVFAFSSFSNFGILARQRVQVLPFYLVFLALPEFQTLPSLKALREQRRNRPRPLTPPPRRRVRRPYPVAQETSPAVLEPSREGLVYGRGNGAPSD
jgi:hypothetical protein